MNSVRRFLLIVSLVGFILLAACFAVKNPGEPTSPAAVQWTDWKIELAVSGGYYGGRREIPPRRRS